MTHHDDSEIKVTVSDWNRDCNGFYPTIEGGDSPRLNAHDGSWLDALSLGFGHRTYLIQAFHGETVTGLLPLCFVRGIFGKFLVSLPYVNTGGVCATTKGRRRQTG